MYILNKNKSKILSNQEILKTFRHFRNPHKAQNLVLLLKTNKNSLKISNLIYSNILLPMNATLNYPLTLSILNSKRRIMMSEFILLE